MKETEIDFDRYIIYEDGRIFSKAKNDFMTTEVKTKPGGYVQNTYKLKDDTSYTFYRHRVIWTYFNGEIPDVLEIDHIVPIRNGGSNSLDNLRLTDSIGNMNNPITVENMKNGCWNNKERNRIISDKNRGHIVTEEQKKKQSEKMSGKNHPFYGKKRPKHSERMKGEKNPFFGKTHTEETKRKISETRNKKPVAQIDKTTGEIIKTFSSLVEVNRTLGFDGSFISACCKGKHSTAYGFKWSFV